MSNGSMIVIHLRHALVSVEDSSRTRPPRGQARLGAHLLDAAPLRKASNLARESCVARAADGPGERHEEEGRHEAVGAPRCWPSPPRVGLDARDRQVGQEEAVEELHDAGDRVGHHGCIGCDSSRRRSSVSGTTYWSMSSPAAAQRADRVGALQPRTKSGVWTRVDDVLIGQQVGGLDVDHAAARDGRGRGDGEVLDLEHHRFVSAR